MFGPYVTDAATVLSIKVVIQRGMKKETIDVDPKTYDALFLE
jgi:hypothetical protein